MKRPRSEEKLGRTPAELPKQPEERNALVVVTLSGGSGHTVNEILKAALAQFDQPDVHVVRKARVRSARSLRKIMQEAVEQQAAIVHSLVDPKLREVVLRESTRFGLPVVDVLGPVINVLSDYLGRSPRNQPGLSYQLHKEHLDRVDSVDFTLAHDDGCGLYDLDQADVVLVGASRVAKSVTCFYLAYRGIRAANVPLIPNREPPPELTRLNPKKVIGLTMNARHLQNIRATRLHNMNADQIGEYLEYDQIVEELRYVRDLMAKYRWRCVDVSYKAVEEVAKEVAVLAGLEE